jgi:YggT family protein
MDRNHPLVRTLDQVCDPILRPFQRLLPPMGGMDFSPIIAILTLQFGSRLLAGFLVGLGH